MSELRYDDKVVVVTGAGAGLGKAYALFYGSRGAKVVVNDLGGSFNGEGADTRAAATVVEEIKKAGGIAVADYNSVEFGDKIIETAVNAFGTVHVLINNAGILRDVSLKNMTDKDWDLVYTVHLLGAYKTCRAAWPYFRKQKFGRIINTSSSSGLYGSFGQANYSAAKLGLVGLAETLAKEGAKYNITANAIAPTAASRLTETVMPPEVLKRLKPEFVVPLVAYLTHESCKETWGIYEVGAGYCGKIRWERSAGATLKADDSLTPSAVQAKWAEITDFSNPQYPNGPNDFLKLLENAKHAPSNKQGEKIDFTGKVAIVTGSGNGLGRAYARLLAKLGAKVVVNDIANPDNTVNEIKAAGGIAVGDRNNVEDGDAVVKTAIDNFGTVHIVINNAGILRDKSFQNMTDAQWDAVYRVHLHGTYKVTKAAWPYMLKQKYGRIVNTTSTSGIYGNFGQANYSAAKLGILGFTKTIALEGKKYNILANTVAPNAGTAMTATIMPPEMVQAFKPEYVAPTSVLLCSDKCPCTGDLFEVGSGWTGATRYQSSGGHYFDKLFTPEDVQANWKKIASFDDGRTSNPKFSTETNAHKLFAFENQAQKKKAGSKNASLSGPDSNSAVPGGGLLVAPKVDPAKFKPAAVKVFPKEYTYNFRDLIIYNLGIGARAVDTKWVFEHHKDFEVLPTFVVIPPFGASVNIQELVPNFDMRLLLHGEQYCEIINWPLPPSATLVTNPSLVETVDKGKAGVVVTAGETRDKNTGKVYFKTTSTTFIKGAGGWGGQRNFSDRGAATAANTPPKRSPDYVASQKTKESQAAIYRLSGDYNPLHIDPAFAAVGKFPQPILHGLASFGISGKLLYEKFGMFKNIKVRFSNVVYPGETLQVEAWKEGNKVIFQTRIVERNLLAITGGAIELHNFGSNHIHIPFPKEVTGLGSEGKKVDPKDFKPGPVKGKEVVYDYSFRDLILYNLGIGAKKTDLDLVYEGNKNFTVIPTFAVIPPFLATVNYSEIVPNFSLPMVLHGEQYAEIVNWPLPKNGSLVSTPRLIETVDKGKAAVIVVGSETKDKKSGKVYFRNQSSMFCRGAGGWGGQKEFSNRGNATAANKPPSRAPDFVSSMKVDEDQTAIYRLSGDLNPLHIDPEFARRGGLKEPILHGLSSFGMSGLMLYRKYGMFKDIKVRFSNMVIPGETLRVEAWQEGNKVIFQTRIIERNVFAITGGAIELGTPGSGSNKL
ncbi:hypothetical protein CANCADRAFT_33032 [Tortispora caseinolytica NRRL Y-17796]|uniref:Peroxisomal hydratase-dehydrogenase-epimerase n=1 Tax=Tortispora caseinolytica NRRL Y-17796 TaxID=767744 RepID=A0A1E4T9L4_9ASCO|nr:hypothetical protein CANCADRAFT_33032 [Tortispora caseinolytica NRRL Y-17796]